MSNPWNSTWNNAASRRTRHHASTERMRLVGEMRARTAVEQSVAALSDAELVDAARALAAGQPEHFDS